ncbi:hypothetical protein D3C86_1670600 [compost metagenome]
MGQAPARLAAAVQMQFQLVFQHQTLLQHSPVLFGVTGPQLLGKHLGAGFPQQRFQLLQTTALHQRAVGHDITRLHILDEDRRIRNDVEHGQQKRDTCQQLLDGFGAVRVVALAQQRKRILSHLPVSPNDRHLPIVLISSSTPKENINRE